MKKDIHPEYHRTDIVCGTCGSTWAIGSTKASMRVSICANCHPFYTGEQRVLVDTEGQVDRFMKRLAMSRERQADAARREEQKKKGKVTKKKSLLEEIYGDEAAVASTDEPEPIS